MLRLPYYCLVNDDLLFETLFFYVWDICFSNCVVTVRPGDKIALIWSKLVHSTSAYGSRFGGVVCS